MKRNPFASDEPITLASETIQLTAANLNYDYTQLPEKSRLHVQSAAAQIKLNFKRAQNSILEIGKHLTYAKELLGHGQWGDWLTSEFDLSDRSAQRYMQAYSTYGARPEAANLLTSSALMLLSSDSIPEPARQEVEQKAKETGKSPTKTELQMLVAKHKPKTAPVDTDKHGTVPTGKPTQKPAEQRQPPIATNTRTLPSAPEIAQPAPASISDSPATADLIQIVSAALKVMPDIRRVLNEPGHIWVNERLETDLRTTLSRLRQA